MYVTRKIIITIKEKYFNCRTEKYMGPKFFVSIFLRTTGSYAIYISSSIKSLYLTQKVYIYTSQKMFIYISQGV